MFTFKLLNLYIYLLLIFIALNGLVSAQTLRVGYIEFPPVFSTNDHGQPQGLLIDLASKVIPEAGYKWEAHSYPVTRMADYIAKGKLDLWIGLKTIPVFRDTTHKGESELLTVTLKAYRTTSLPDIKKKEDLREKSIIIIRGFSYGGWIDYITDQKNNIDYIETHDHVAAFRMLKAKRAQYLLDYSNPAQKALRKIEVKNIQTNVISSFGAYFVVSKKTPNSAEVIENLESAYKRLIKSGTLK